MNLGTIVRDLEIVLMNLRNNSKRFRDSKLKSISVV